MMKLGKIEDIWHWEWGPNFGPLNRQKTLLALVASSVDHDQMPHSTCIAPDTTVRPVKISKYFSYSST